MIRVTAVAASSCAACQPPYLQAATLWQHAALPSPLHVGAAHCSCCLLPLAHTQVASRKRDAHGAGTSAKLAQKLAAGQEGLQREDFVALIAANFWLTRDNTQLIQTVKAMTAAGYDPDEGVLLQLLHVYCTSGMWGEALQVLDDLAAGRISIISSEAAAGASRQRGRNREAAAEQQPTLAGRKSSREGWRARQHGDLAESAGANSQQPLAQDRLWHVVMRKLWEQRASDSLLNEFLSRMTSEQLQRFKMLYNLRALPGGDGYTMQPLEDWQLPVSPERQQQGVEDGQGAVQEAVAAARPLHLV